MMTTAILITAQLTTAWTDLYTVPVGATARLDLLQISNTHATNSVDVSVRLAAPAPGGTARLCNNHAVPVRDAIAPVAGRPFLAGGVVIQGRASADAAAEAVVTILLRGA